MSKEKTKKEEVVSDDTLIDYLVENNSYEYNMDKAIEEAIEFAEVLIKLKTKSKSNPKRPDQAEAIKEFGDVILRGRVALNMLFAQEIEEDENFVFEAIEKHISGKCVKLRGYLEKGSYKGGL